MFGSSRGKPKKVKADETIDSETVERVFSEYADPDDADVMTMDGIGKLSEDLGIDASTDIRILVILWTLGSGSKPGSITKTEFVNGMKSLRRDSVSSLKSALPSFDPGFLDRNQFREFYKFVFQFSREGTHKTIEKDIVLSLLPLVLDSHRAPHLNLFMDFLKQSTHQRITLDQWDSFLQFNQSVQVDLKGYDSDSAWPLLLDEYVEWRKPSSITK